MQVSWLYVDHSKGRRIAPFDRLISYYGYDGTGSGRRYSHVALIPAGHRPQVANIYAEAKMVKAAPLPKEAAA